MEKKRLHWGSGSAALSLVLVQGIGGIAPGTALPVPEEQLDEAIPEEVLRTEIILDARSPVDGKPLTAAEYAVLQEELMAPDRVPELPSEVQHTIFLLRILRAFRVLTPL